jgi:hypothetical protein
MTMTAPTKRLSAEEPTAAEVRTMMKAPALLSAEDYQRMINSPEFARLQPVLSRMLRGEKSPAKVRRDGLVVDQHRGRSCSGAETTTHDDHPPKCDSAGGRAMLRQRLLARLPVRVRERERCASLSRLVGLLLDELEK